MSLTKIVSLCHTEIAANKQRLRLGIFLLIDNR